VSLTTTARAAPAVVIAATTITTAITPQDSLVYVWREKSPDVPR
jgi:hypothetical protein